MLSPLDLQNKKIVTKKRKYDKAEMDEYLELVFENYKALFDENQELQKKVKTLSDGIQYYRSIESTMQKALVLAEKTSKETKDAALLKAEAIEKDATTKASHIVSEAEQEYEKIKDKCIALVQQFNQYKMQLKQVASAQLELITSESFDVYSPELDALQNERALPTAQEEEKPEETAVELPLDDINEAAVTNELNTEELEEESDLDKTVILPDLKSEKENTETVSDEDTISILTADTIDLRDSIQKIQQEEEKNGILEPIQAEPKEVQDALVVDPVDAKTSKPLEAELKDMKSSAPEILEPISEKEKEAPTLDSLLQSMNMSSKKKKKKGQDEDPFEFLGSVDDF